MERLGGFRRQPDRHRQVAEGFGQVALRAQKIAAAEIGEAVIRIGLDGAAEIRERLLVLVGLPKREGAVGVGRGVARVELHRLVEVRDRVTVAPTRA